MSNRGDGCWRRQPVPWVLRRCLKKSPRRVNLKHCKTMPKIVQHCGNLDNPEQCFVRLFKRYNSLYPKKPARQCLLCVTPIKSQAYMLVLTCSSWTQQVEKCSCRHVQASSYPGVPYKPFPLSNCSYTSVSDWGGWADGYGTHRASQSGRRLDLQMDFLTTMCSYFRYS